MKRKFLVLSVTMLTVCGAALLQSCSSEFEYYDETEEYGYYTEEEIAAIEAMAKMYGLDLEINKNYYGTKKSLIEHENEMIGLSALLGEHKLILQKNENGEILYASQKKDEDIYRTTTRFIEGKGSWSGEKSGTPYDFKIKVTIKWEGDGTERGVNTSGNVSITKGKGIYSNNNKRDYSSGNITTREYGMDGISFEGTVSYAAYKGKKDNPDTKEIVEVDCFTLYQFSILNGYVSTTGNGDGTFIVKGNDNTVYKKS